MNEQEMRDAFAKFQATAPVPSAVERARLIFGETWAASRALNDLVFDHYRKRSWRERLFSWPWRPWRRWVCMRQWSPEEIEMVRAQRAKAFPANRLPDPMTIEL